MSIREKFNSLPKGLMFLIVVFGLGLVFILDIVTGNEISFSILYLVPISICLWYVGRWEAVTIAIIGAVLWFIGENRKAYSFESIAYWNAFVRLGFFFVVVVLLDYVKKFNNSQEDIIRARTVELTREITERKRAEAEVKVINEQLSHLAMNIQNLKEEENQRIAREIHDELGQVLTALKIDAAWFKRKYGADRKTDQKVESMNVLIDDTIKSVRKISTDLRPRLLDELGLFPAMEAYVREFQTKYGIRCNLKLSQNEIVIDEFNSLNIFRVFQEAMTNIARHAEATHVNIKVTVDPSEISMGIKDNGVGIKEVTPKANTLGILGMQERVKLLNGKLKIENSPGYGTIIKVNIPINQTETKL